MKSQHKVSVHRFPSLDKNCSVLAAVMLALASVSAEPRDWRIYGGDLVGTKYSALDQINRSNITRLKPAWIYRCDDMRLRPASTIECNPIIIDGTMFITTPGLKLAALDAASGAMKWIFDPWAG